MKLKLGIIYGILIWFFVYLITVIFSPLITDNIPYINIVAPIAIITVTGFLESSTSETSMKMKLLKDLKLEQYLF